MALISRDPALRIDEALQEFPEFAERLRGSEHGSVQRGAITVSRRLARVSSDRVALVGDASGGVDAITGEGLCLAFKQAHLLGACMASESLSSYRKGHRKIFRRASTMARLMLMLASHERLRHRVMRTFAAEPRMFQRMLAAHIGATSPTDLFANGLALGWKLVTT